MSKKLYMTNADYVAIAVSPALIMALVGSLVYFLIEVMYVGDYQARLNYAFGLFVFAAVLIARISIEFGSEHATLYALPLGIAMFLFLVRFVEQPSSFGHVINLGLMGLVWWCAHKLTWDSTVIDDAEDASGEGLMQRIGVDDGLSTGTAAAGATDNELVADADQPSSAWQRLWRAFVRPRKGPHTPGMWVLYFSLAALPLFGIGQHWIPAAQVGRRQYAFTLLLVYVASALSLLVTTSFLNLRRYLRQRRVEMPPVIAGTWVGIGAVLIVIVMMLAMLIPRPGAEVAISQAPWQAGSPGGMSPSRYAMNRDGGEEQEDGQSAPAGEKMQEEPSPDGQPAGEPVDDQQQSNGQSGDNSQQGDSQGPSQQQGGQQQSGQQQDSQQSSDASQQGRSDPNSDQSKKDGNASDQGKTGGEQNKSDRDKGGEGGQKSAQGSDQSQAEQQQTQTESKPDASPPREEQQDEQSQGQGSSSSPTSQISDRLQSVSSMLGGLTGLLKILLYVVLALALGYGIWKYRHELMKALADILGSLRELFGGKRADEAAQEQEAAQTKRVRAFAEFRDPFQSGEHRQMPPEELVRYTFAAFEAWANDRGKPRDLDCTPQEFVRIVLPPDSEMHAEARRLARLYSEAAYAGARTPREAANELRGLWQMMQEVRTRDVARMA
jgi:hypothetical protein